MIVVSGCRAPAGRRSVGSVTSTASSTSTRASRSASSSAVRAASALRTCRARRADPLAGGLARGRRQRADLAVGQRERRAVADVRQAGRLQLVEVGRPRQSPPAPRRRRRRSPPAAGTQLRPGRSPWAAWRRVYGDAPSGLDAITPRTPYGWRVSQPADEPRRRRRSSAPIAHDSAGRAISATIDDQDAPCAHRPAHLRAIVIAALAVVVDRVWSSGSSCSTRPRRSSGRGAATASDAASTFVAADQRRRREGRCGHRVRQVRRSRAARPRAPAATPGSASRSAG